MMLQWANNGQPQFFAISVQSDPSIPQLLITGLPDKTA